MLPPLNGLVAAVAGFAWRRRRAGRITLAGGLAVLWATSLPVVADTFLASLERGIAGPNVASDMASPAAPGAIIVLGGDGATFFRGGVRQLDVGALSLARLRGAAVLARQTGLPVLITGGSVMPASGPIAIAMADSLQTDFAVKTRWVETASRDTWENAALSAPMLRHDGITTAYLVTHPWHMRRALMAFRAASFKVGGFKVIAAPLSLDGKADPADPQAWLPHMAAWQKSYFAAHEWIGCFWYALRRG